MLFRVYGIIYVLFRRRYIFGENFKEVETKKYRCFIDVFLRLCNNKYVVFGFEFV